MENAFKISGALGVAALALVILATATACTPATIDLDQSDSGARVQAARGDFVTIALPSFPGADRGWVATQLESKMLRAEEEPRFVARSDAGEAPGVELFRYRVMADGETTVRLEYTGDDSDRLGSPASFSVTLLVGGPAGS